ncbi:MAG: NarK/NasA family nitrate transporter [Chloroflexi bacterium]|nr:NarK/NasA family nitrate transporter [Chloroflexota bacterium]
MKALLLATLAFALCFAVWGLISPLAPRFRDLFQLSETEVGLLLATPVLLGSLFRIPMGLLADRFGGRTMFSLLMAFLIVPLAFIGFAASYWQLLFWAFWLGLAGSSFAIGIPFVSRWFTAGRQGVALGVFGMGNIGTALAAGLAPRIASRFDWPAAFWTFIPVLLAAALVFWLAGRDAPARPGPPPSPVSMAVVLTRPLTWLLSLFYFVTFGGFVAFSIFLPTLLVQLFGLDPTDAGARTAFFVVLATLARPLGGYLADKLGGLVVLNWLFGVIVASGVLLAFQPPLPLATVGFLGAALAFGLGNGAVFKLVAQFFARETGVVTGIVGAAGGFGGFFPPLILGFARDIAGSYAPGFALLAMVALICLFLSGRLSRG